MYDQTAALQRQMLQVIILGGNHDSVTLIMIISLPEYFAQKTCHYKTAGKLTHYCFNNEVYLKKFRISFPKARKLAC